MAIPRPRSFSISFPESPRSRLRSSVASAIPRQAPRNSHSLQCPFRVSVGWTIPPEVGLDLFDQPAHLSNQRLDPDSQGPVLLPVDDPGLGGQRPKHRGQGVGLEGEQELVPLRDLVVPDEHHGDVGGGTLPASIFDPLHQLDQRSDVACRGGGVDDDARAGPDRRLQRGWTAHDLSLDVPGEVDFEGPLDVSPIQVDSDPLDVVYVLRAYRRP